MTPSGKFAFFKAIVIGEPKPTVTWSRNNGDVSDPARYQTKYDPVTDEHTFEASDRGLSSVFTTPYGERGQSCASRKINIAQVKSRWGEPPGVGKPCRGSGDSMTSNNGDSRPKNVQSRS